MLIAGYFANKFKRKTHFFANTYDFLAKKLGNLNNF